MLTVSIVDNHYFNAVVILSAFSLVTKEQKITTNPSASAIVAEVVYHALKPVHPLFNVQAIINTVVVVSTDYIG